MISVIIPTYNEAAHIQSTIQKLRQYDEGNYIQEIIVADGGSTDDTACVAEAELVSVVISPKKGSNNFFIIYFMYRLVIPSKKLVATYKK